MKKVKQIVLSVALWIFVTFCLIMAIGMPFGIGTVLMLLTAVMAMPIVPVRKVWDVFFGVLPQKKRKLFSSKKKQEEKRKVHSKQTKRLIIAVFFLFGFVFSMAATETTDEPAYSTEIPIDTTIEETSGAPTEPDIDYGDQEDQDAGAVKYHSNEKINRLLNTYNAIAEHTITPEKVKKGAYDFQAQAICNNVRITIYATINNDLAVDYNVEAADDTVIRPVFRDFCKAINPAITNEDVDVAWALLQTEQYEYYTPYDFKGIE